MQLAKFALVALPILAQQATEPSSALVGTITTSVNRGCFHVAPAGNTKPTHRRSPTTVVCYSPATVLSTTSKDLKPGQQIYVVGVGFKNGKINATRVTIYNTDIPVQ